LSAIAKPAALSLALFIARPVLSFANELLTFLLLFAFAA